MTYKVLYIDSIETNQSGVESNIQLSHLFTKNVRTFAIVKQLLEFVESTEYRRSIFVVGFLIRSKAGLVHARVQIRLHPFGNLVDSLA